MPQGTVLVVDDDFELREAISDLLDDVGYDPVCVSDGAAAIAHLKSDAPLPRVILLDLMMPIMNGWQFREAQLQDPDLDAIPVVVMTASRNQHGKPIQVDGVLYKPLTLDQLIAAIEPYIDPRPA